MASSLTIIDQPQIEPVSIDQARRHARIDSQNDDDLIQAYAKTARVMVERYLSRALITQTLRYTLMPERPPRPDRHFFHNPLELPRAPVQSITSVTVIDERGNSTALSPTTLPVLPPPFTGYIANLSVTPPQLRLGLDTVLTDGRWLRHVMLDRIEVVFVAGYGDKASDVPPNIAQAVLMGTAWLYEARGDVPAELPQAIQWLLDPDRLMWV